MIKRRQAAQAEWTELWRIWWETLDHIEGEKGEVDDSWDRYALAVFLDVPALGLRDLIPEIVESEFARDFDLLGAVTESAQIGIERIEAASGELLDRRLPLELYTTEMILLWEWKRGQLRGEKTMAYVNRIRQLRDDSPGIELDDRAVADFIFRLASREN